MPGGSSRIAGEDRHDRVRTARRQQQGHLGAVGRTGRLRRCRSRPAAPRDAAARASAATSSRAAETSVLAGPLRGAQRERGAAAALGADAACTDTDDVPRPGCSRSLLPRLCASRTCSARARGSSAPRRLPSIERAPDRRASSTVQDRRSLAFNVDADGARRRRRARPAVVRQLAGAQPAAPGVRRRRRRAASMLDDALELHRPGDHRRSSPSAASRWRT